MQCLPISFFFSMFNDSVSMIHFQLPWLHKHKTTPTFFPFFCSVLFWRTKCQSESLKAKSRKSKSLYEEVSHLYAKNDGVRIRAWAPTEICLNVLITPSRGIPSLKPTTGHVMDGTARFVKTREMEKERVRERERLPLPLFLSIIYSII